MARPPRQADSYVLAAPGSGDVVLLLWAEVRRMLENMCRTCFDMPSSDL